MTSPESVILPLAHECLIWTMHRDHAGQHREFVFIVTGRTVLRASTANFDGRTNWFVRTYDSTDAVLHETTLMVRTLEGGGFRMELEPTNAYLSRDHAASFADSEGSIGPMPALERLVNLAADHADVVRPFGAA